MFQASLVNEGKIIANGISDGGVGILYGNIDNLSYIYGSYAAVFAQDATTVTNADTIAAKDFGVRMVGTVRGSIDNNGTISGGAGIIMESGGSVSNSGSSPRRWTASSWLAPGMS